MHLLTLFNIAQYLFCWKWKVRYLIQIDIFLYIFQNWKKFYTTVHTIFEILRTTACKSWENSMLFHKLNYVFRSFHIAFLLLKHWFMIAIKRTKCFFFLRKEIQYLQIHTKILIIRTRCSQYNMHYNVRMYFVHRIEYVIRSLDSMSPLCDQSIEIQRNT